MAVVAAPGNRKATCDLGVYSDLAFSAILSRIPTKSYKILFLDVLFPLHVKKIIYVDADQVSAAQQGIADLPLQIQVVRADMKELVDLDLQEAPYGYTPFCSSRTEMDGYRLQF